MISNFMHVLTAVEFVIGSLFDVQNSHEDNHGKQIMLQLLKEIIHLVKTLENSICKLLVLYFKRVC